MTHDLDDVPIHLRWPGARRVVVRQQEQMKMFASLESAMQNLWDCCASARMASSRSRRHLVEGNQLQQLVEACEEGLLAQVPEENRIQLSIDASHLSERHLAQCWESLGDLAILADAEVGLRVLFVLTVKSAREAYAPEMQLPAWDRLILEADTKSATTIDAWRKCAEER